MKKYLILKSCVGPNGNFKRGEVVEIDTNLGNQLLEAGIAQKVEEKKRTAASTKAKKRETR